VNGIKEMTDNIAHDLKSPITRIRGQAEIALTGGGSSADLETMAASAVEECDRLLEMINSMLFISRTDAGVTQPELKEIDIAAVIRDACGLFQSLAEEKRIDLTWDAPEYIETKGDIRLVQRMLANLLDNAISYTPRGGWAKVSLRLNPDRSLLITVENSGGGISEKDLPHIFERFYRGDPSRSHPGAGLGLTFARAVARAHGGDITASSSSAGSTFTVNLPAHA
jgi:signal transduction histidine kinase